MATVVVNLAMSLDGFIAYPDDTVGPLFDWYFNGSEEVQAGGETFRLSPVSADVFRQTLGAIGAFVVGRRLYDHTNGWNATPPAPAPLVVLTHNPPHDWPRGGVPITFETGVESAVASASALAGDKLVSVAGAEAARACLDAGLLDEVQINLVPVAMGKGIPLLAGICTGPVRFHDPEVVQAAGVLHLRYRVRR